MSALTRLTQFFSKSESKHQIGVSIGPAGLMLCYLNEKNKVSYQELPLEIMAPQKVVNDTDTKTVSTSVTKLLTKNKVSGNCHLVLPASHYQMVQVDKPNVPKDEIVAALKWQVKDLVTIEVDDLIVDYFDVPVLLAGNPKVNVVCASKTFLTAMVGSINQGEIKLSTISTEEFAFLSLLPRQDDAILLVCQQRNAEIVLLIVQNGQLYFHRRLRGFAQISQQSEQELAMGITDSLSLEIQRSTDYFERQLKQSPIKSIQVFIPSDNEQYLVDKLGLNTNILVQLLALPEQYQGQRKYGLAIGASLLSTLEQSDA
jgi:MSHA biogenesis protein MshI